MTIDQATAILREMRRAAPAGEVAIQAILFGIKYHDQLEDVSLNELSERVGVSRDICHVQLRHGIKLAKYVALR